MAGSRCSPYGASRAGTSRSGSRLRSATGPPGWTSRTPTRSSPAGRATTPRSRPSGTRGGSGARRCSPRLEGAVRHHGTIYFVSTQGGATASGDSPPGGFGRGRGQVWAYETWSGLLRLVYESPGSVVLDLPDNVTTSPRGTLVLCELVVTTTCAA
nr:hypothetical protein [Planomonospora parontospora]